ncbi:MAG: cell division protein FtsQ/DivIB [Alphaproteobacteria bacterium]
MILQKTKKYLILFSAIILVGWTIASIRHTLIKKTPILEIKVQGILHFTSTQLIEETLSKYKNQKLFFTSLKTIQKKLEDLPYVKKANIRRLPPYTLEIKIEEEKPIALYIASEDKTYPISENGKIIPNNALLDLPLITTKITIKKSPDLLKKIQNYPAIKKQLSAIEWIGNRRWNLHFENSIILLSENLGSSLNRLNNLIKTNKITLSGTLDFRDEKRVFLTD